MITKKHQRESTLKQFNLFSNISDPELYSLITKKCKSPQNFDLPGSFDLKSFHGFFILGGRIKPIACFVLFGHKDVRISSLESLYKKKYRTSPTASSQNFRKHQNAANPIPFFLKDQNEISKKLGGRRDQIFKISSGETKQDGRGERTNKSMQGRS